MSTRRLRIRYNCEMNDKSVRVIIQFVSLFLTGVFLFVGFLFLLLSLGQYETLQGFLNQFAPDGNLESFTPAFHSQIRIPLLFFGGILFLLGGASVTFRAQYKEMMEETFHWIPLFFQALIEDAKDFIRLLVPEKVHWWEWLLLAVIIILAFAGRWTMIDRPMMHDESYTFIAFAKFPLKQVISDYHLPNNHILNSVLIHFLYEWIGNPGPVVVRLPAMLAGVLTAISGYFFTRREFGKGEAMTAAILIAVLPWHIEQSVNGRGYTMMGLFTLWMVALSLIVQRSRNRFAWILLIIVSALNFWTLPVALYPFTIIAVWLALSALVGDIADEYDGLWNFSKYYFGFGVTTAILVFLLYTPVFFFGSGWNSFFHNPFVSALTWNDFVQTLPIRLAETWRSWTIDLPLLIVVFMAAGEVLYLVFRRRLTQHRISLPLTTLAVLTVIFIIQKPNPWARTWTYLLPMVLIWSTAGWYALLHQVASPKHLQTLIIVMTAVLLIGMTGFGVSHFTQNLAYYQGEKGQEETVTVWLGERVTEEDYVFVSVTFEPAFWFYFDRYQFPEHTILYRTARTWRSTFLVVDDRDNLNYDELLLNQTLVTIADCPESIVDKVYEYGHYTVYQCDASQP